VHFLKQLPKMQSFPNNIFLSAAFPRHATPLHNCTNGGGSGPYESQACVEICRLLLDAKADVDRVPGG
jgi:hypothetical protein